MNESVVSPPLSADEFSLELHTVQLDSEAVKRLIRDLLNTRARLHEPKTTLETSHAIVHKSKISMRRGTITPSTALPCVFLCKDCAPMTYPDQVRHAGTDKPRTLAAPAAEVAPLEAPRGWFWTSISHSLSRRGCWDCGCCNGLMGCDSHIQFCTRLVS